MSFEERAGDLAANVQSLGYDLETLIASGKLSIDHVRVERSEIEETGEYDLEGLFVRLGFAVDAIGAKRVVLDSIEVLFSGFSNDGLLRAELRRLFGWIKDRGPTAIITGERGDQQLTRHGLKNTFPTASSCSTTALWIRLRRAACESSIIEVLHTAQTSIPFLIDEGASALFRRLRLSEAHILPRRSSRPEFPASTGCSVKVACTTDRASWCRACPARARRRSPATLSRRLANAASAAWCLHWKKAPGSFAGTRSRSAVICKSTSMRSFYALMRPAKLLWPGNASCPHPARVEAFKPAVVVIDPISAFRGPAPEVHSTLLRMIDLLKSCDITAMFTQVCEAAARCTRGPTRAFPRLWTPGSDFRTSRRAANATVSFTSSRFVE